LAALLKRFLLYGHGSSYNHGGEAIVKATISFIRSKYPKACIVLSSHFPAHDKRFDVPANMIIGPDPVLWDLEKQAVDRKEKYELARQMYAEAISYIEPDTICLSIGGDNYCYPNWHRLECFHRAALNRRAKSILWSCSIEPSTLNSEMLNILAEHHLITARESLTYSALYKKGLTNILKCPDIAFSLNPEPFDLPENIKNTVALNLSPLVIRREPVPGMVIEAFRHLVRYILDFTNMNIAFILHVLLPMDNDCDAINAVLEGFEDNPRIFRVFDDLNAAKNKYIISRCRFGVFARTHASIAAYGSCVPSITLGYSVKAAGIAMDLGFSDYVCSIESLTTSDVITKLFTRLVKHEDDLRSLLKHTMPEYKRMILPEEIFTF
jgi:polysaccharide pyruvyl transferase WcaK-like protein